MIGLLARSWEKQLHRFLGGKVYKSAVSYRVLFVTLKF